MDTATSLLRMRGAPHRRDQRTRRGRTPTRAVRRTLTARSAVKRVLSSSPLGAQLHPTLTDIPIGFRIGVVLMSSRGDGRQGGAPASPVSACSPQCRPRDDRTLRLARHERQDQAHRRRAHGGDERCGGIRVRVSRARRHGHHVRGALLGFAGLGAVTVGGYLGGHLVYENSRRRRRGLGDRRQWLASRCRADELNEDTPLGATIRRCTRRRRAAARQRVRGSRRRAHTPAARSTKARSSATRFSVRGTGSEFCLAATARSNAVRPRRRNPSTRPGCVPVRSRSGSSIPTRSQSRTPPSPRPRRGRCSLACGGLPGTTKPYSPGKEHRLRRHGCVFKRASISGSIANRTGASVASTATHRSG